LESVQSNASILETLSIASSFGRNLLASSEGYDTVIEDMKE